MTAAGPPALGSPGPGSPGPDAPGPGSPGPGSPGPVERSPESAALARYRAAARRRRAQPDQRRGDPLGPGRRATMRRLAGAATGPGPDPRDPQPVGSLWSRFTSAQGWTQEIAVWSLTSRWSELVGPQIAEHVAVVRFDGEEGAPAIAEPPGQTALLPAPAPAPADGERSGGRLVLQADSAAWQQQLVWGLAHLQRRLDAELGRGVVGSIVILGPQQPRSGGRRRARKP